MRHQQAENDERQKKLHAVVVVELFVAGADEIGYEDAGAFLRPFRRQVGVTAAQYRKYFGGLRGVLGAAVLGVGHARIGWRSTRVLIRLVTR